MLFLKAIKSPELLWEEGFRFMNYGKGTCRNFWVNITKMYIQIMVLPKQIVVSLTTTFLT